MKRFYLAALAAAALTFSCQKNEVVVENPTLNAPIEFGTYLGNAPQTKGLVTNNADAGATSTLSIKKSGFGINATYTGKNNWAASGVSTLPNFMYDQEVKYVNDAWTYSPLKYWPTMTEDQVSFFAWAPYGADGITLWANSAAANKLDFTVQSNASKMVDFVAGNAIDEKHGVNSADAAGRSAVVFNLYHELTRLNFKARVDLNNNPAIDGKTWVVVKSVKLDGEGQFYSKATYTFNDADMGDNVRGTWSNYTKMAATGYPVDIFNAVDLTSTIANAYTTQGVAVKDDVDTNEEAVPLFGTNEYLFLIPAETPTTTAGSVTFEYDIVTVDSKLNGGYSCTNAVKTVNLPANIMEQGKAYNLIFTFFIDAIEVEANVADWTNGADNYADVPYSPDSI